MDAWYKVATPRKEVREGRSFNPDEFAIALEQVVAGKGPGDYTEPKPFFSRTCFTRALREHACMVLRRLDGQTANTAPVLTLITQFGGGKTHTLATLFHLVNSGEKAKGYDGVPALLKEAGLSAVPRAKVAVFVGNAWDPRKGCETPWLHIADKLAGEKGIEALGPSAKTKPPGTEALGRLYEAAGGAVLILFDEVLNFLNRHRDMADSFHAFIQNLTVSMTGTTHGAAVISLPRSQVEMNDWDTQWQEKITKVVRRVAKDLIVADEAEISEVIRRRLFEDLGNERVRRSVAKAYADWCFENRAQLPPECTVVDAGAKGAKVRELLQQRFESCYPFHPATLSVFQRKWQALRQYQQTRGTLAMLAQWISKARKQSFEQARPEPLITLGSAPLEILDFRSVVLGQVGENRLLAALDADISGAQSHARALDSDTKGPLRDIHRRVGTAIFFESSGGQVDKVAHLPELRFALGGPDVDTTSVDNAARALEAKAFFIRPVGSDGFRIHHQPTLKKVVGDRRASLDEDTEVKPAMRKLVEQEFRKGASLPLIPFPEDGAAVQDSPKLTVYLMDPETEWSESKALRQQMGEWTRRRGKSDRLYPASIIWCFKKPGRDLREKVELWLAWRRVVKDVADGVLGEEFERKERDEVQAKLRDAEDDAIDEVWASYRFVALFDAAGKDGLKVIDLGAGHSSNKDTLCGRIVTAMQAESLLSQGIGAGYLERNWPTALKESGAWPLASLRQSYLNGSLTRLLDPDTSIRGKVLEFVQKGDFGLASGKNPDGTYQRLWFEEVLAPDEVTFEPNVYLLRKAAARALKRGEVPDGLFQPAKPEPAAKPTEPEKPEQEPEKPTPAKPKKQVLRVSGAIPPEVWNRLGTKVLPKLRGGEELKVGVDLSAVLPADSAKDLERDLKQIIEDLGLSGKLRVEREED